MPPNKVEMEREKVARFYVDKYNTFLAAGMKPGLAYENLVEQGYTQSERSIRLQTAAVALRGKVFNRVSMAGRKPKLNDDQKEEVCRWIKSKNEANTIVTRRGIAKYIRNTWDIKLHRCSVGNFMLEQNLSQRVTGKVTGKANVSFEAKEVLFWDFVLKLRRENTLAIPAASIHSIDATYTRDPDKHARTKLKDGGKHYHYSDAIITMISPVDGNPTPCMLFTYNSRMAPQATSNGAQAKARREEFVALLEEMGIDEDRIVYDKSLKRFRGEDPDMYELFLKRYDLPKIDVILHDGGGAFKRKKTSIFDSLGFTKHVTYPTEVHQWLSPNDNNLHGCKEVWKSEFPDFDDNPRAPLRLMQLIDQDASVNARYYFERNILRVTKAKVARVMRG